MKTVRINISEFKTKYLNLIPEDIMEYFNECFLNGIEDTDIRSTVYDEMKIRNFYNEHPNLETKTDWILISLSRHVIDIMKSYINSEVSLEDISELQLKLSIELDKRKVNNEPTDEIQSLYDDILWFKCDILK